MVTLNYDFYFFVEGLLSSVFFTTGSCIGCPSGNLEVGLKIDLIGSGGLECQTENGNFVDFYLSAPTQQTILFHKIVGDVGWKAEVISICVICISVDVG